MKPKGALKKYYILLFSVICFNLLVPGNIFADINAVLSGIKLANTRDDLIAYFKVKNAFKTKTIQAVQNGIPTTFTFYLTLYKTAGNLFDKKIADLKIKSTIKYNSLKEEYTVFRPWKEETPLMTKSFDEAKAWMTEVDNLKVIPLGQLVKADKYQIRIKAELEKVTLPLSLHYVFFFVSFWDFETDWYVINFTY
ncbi:MAG: DUF4390 domain-containing protein [Desulfobacter sp.]|nr:DUF4390 domain-containing protein [Desulfobacter sp.]WDP85111.1 MAG: DUF4390 domain-containing protein [Desulfobacter sp.]